MKALVVYGTRYGTAAEIAEEITEVLEAEQLDVDLKNAKSTKNLDVSPYDLVVVGSGIKMGKWTKESINFLKKNRDNLSNKKVALFVTCGSANDEKTIPEAQEKYLNRVAMENLSNQPITTGLFGSVAYDPNASGLMFKLFNRFIKKEMEDKGEDTSQKVDCRDWDEIRAWSKNLVNK